MLYSKQNYLFTIKLYIIKTFNTYIMLLVMHLEDFYEKNKAAYSN